MTTLLRGEIRTVLQAAGPRQVRGLVLPVGVPLHEARRGPHDGTRGATRVAADGGPPSVLTFEGGEIVYQLDQVAEHGSGRRRVMVATYRYAPLLSPMHPRLMQVVAEERAKHALGQRSA
ncbi:hypothetical protein ACIBSV_12135 [Embleya sp. NPDC050154]|uniref:hypothetical protein n=1 Tax=Embleya sp. NPDC050154 TaxID=3363988 RepID=UPI00378AD7B5